MKRTTDDTDFTDRKGTRLNSETASASFFIRVIREIHGQLFRCLPMNYTPSNGESSPRCSSSSSLLAIVGLLWLAVTANGAPIVGQVLTLDSSNQWVLAET